MNLFGAFALAWTLYGMFAGGGLKGPGGQPMHGTVYIVIQQEPPQLQGGTVGPQIPVTQLTV